MDEQSGKQRLLKLESRIREKFEAWVATGFDLLEIRDNRLYEHVGYKTWTEYLNKRLVLEFGIGKSQAHNRITAAIVKTKIEPIVHPGGQSKKDDWNIKATLELARLAPIQSNKKGKPRDVQALSKVYVNRVVKAVEQEAKRLNKPITATIVRKFVDKDLGIDRAAKAKETIKEREKKPDFRDMVLRYTGSIDGMLSVLTPVEEDSWKILDEDNPGILQKLVDACDGLSGIVRALSFYPGKPETDNNDELIATGKKPKDDDSGVEYVYRVANELIDSNLEWPEAVRDGLTVDEILQQELERFEGKFTGRMRQALSDSAFEMKEKIVRHRVIKRTAKCVYIEETPDEVDNKASKMRVLDREELESRGKTLNRDNVFYADVKSVPLSAPDFAIFNMLGLDPFTSPKEVKSAYRKAAKRMHPDGGGDAGQFMDLKKAYEQYKGNSPKKATL